MDRGSFHTPTEAVLALRLVERVHRGQLQLPLEIVLINQAIEEKKRLAVHFCSSLGCVDMALVYEITDLRRKKDALYSRWIQEESRGLI